MIQRESMIRSSTISTTGSRNNGLASQRKSHTCYMSANIFNTDVGVLLYDTQLTLSRAVEDTLSNPSPISFLLLFSAGLITGLSPCAMSLVPLTIASLNRNGDSTGSSSQLKSSIAYTLGLASVLSFAGISVAVLGSAVSQKGGISNEIPGLLAAALSIIMGLNLLSIITLQFPSLSLSNNIKGIQIPSELKAYLLGASSALVASPCASPVLTSLLAVVASSGNPTLGLVFLFAFSMGYASPIVFAGNLSSLMSKLSSNFDVNSWWLYHQNCNLQFHRYKHQLDKH